jgi:2-haloacid dehalogenase
MGEYLMLDVFPDARPFLESLKGKKKVILSNGSPDMLEPLVRHSGLKFDAVLSVDARQVYKPAPEVYDLVLQHIALPRKEIGFVSSNCWDALGARSFGFRAWWINRAGAPVDRLGFEPEGILRSLDEVAG